ncbi:MAG: dihydrofolate reductase [Lachnospiraceae bacterium]|nr:dihydrofolate reductase [Lachnospiraceae bacterium]MBQ9606780.1 dihydrofolate reductase [Lachnospiraceae bacterium]
MKAIVAVDRNWGIGLKGKLLVHIPADQKFFRETTMGHIVVMGRKTLESFPHGSPLKDRVNIVLTKGGSGLPDDVEIAHSIDELKELLKRYEGEEIYCIGGAKVYEELLPMCDECLVTKIDESYEADAYFPDLDADPEWELVRDGSEEDEQTYFDVIYYFLKYRRVKNTV